MRDQHLLEAIRSELESKKTLCSNESLYQFIDCNYGGHLEELLLQAEAADCTANFDRINLPLHILT